MVMRLSINVHQADLGQSTLLNDPVGCHITLMCHGIYGHSIGLREQILDQGSNGLGRVSLIPETLRHSIDDLTVGRRQLVFDSRTAPPDELSGSARRNRQS